MAVSQSWQALRYASSKLKGDREIVLEAVSQGWETLEATRFRPPQPHIQNLPLYQFVQSEDETAPHKFLQILSSVRNTGQEKLVGRGWKGGGGVL